jgi:hypothetical protein
MDETQYIQLVQSWEHSENLNKLSKRLHSLLLTPTPHHALFALPDYPGLGEENHIDFLDDADINELAQDIQFAHNNISYIKGFVDSGEPVEGPLVEQLRTNIRMDYANNVFSNTTSGNLPNVASMVKQRFFSNQGQSL